MSELHAIVGASLLSFGAATFSYIIYKLYDSRNQRSKDGPVMVLLSETAATIIIGILQLYCFKICEECSEADLENVFNQTLYENRDDCVQVVDCVNKKMFMDQLVLTITAIHCLVSLITSSNICKNFGGICDTAEDQPSTSKVPSKIQNPKLSNLQETIASILSQWLLPIISASVLFYVMNETNHKICEIDIPENFQTLVSEIIEQPLNATEISVYETEFNDVVGKVYSIVESATKSNIRDATNLDEGFEIYNILERLNTPNHRTPKQLKPETFQKIGYKIYMIFFMILGFLLPIIYSNISYMKLKIFLQNSEEKVEQKNKPDLEVKVKYLKMCMISAGALWTPSFAEMFTRTYITETQPNILMHGLMALGSVHMLVKDGMNLKLLKLFVGQKNIITPKV